MPPFSEFTRRRNIFTVVCWLCNDFSRKEAARIYGLENVALRKFFFFAGYVPIFLSEIWYYTKSKAIVVLKKKKKKEKEPQT